MRLDYIETPQMYFEKHSQKINYLLEKIVGKVEHIILEQSPSYIYNNNL